MFENFTAGQTVRVHFGGSTQGLAMRVRYEGTDANGLHHLSGLGVMADAHFTATDTALSNGRAITTVEAV